MLIRNNGINKKMNHIITNNAEDIISLLKPYNIKIENHTIIDEKSPFVLYAIEI